jgi:phosphohistidine phosphatase
MDLILWRHAEARDGAPDSGRELTGKGQRQAKAMAAWLEPRLPKGTRVITSPATRCQQTAAALGEFEEVPAIGVGASAREVLKAAGWTEATGAVVLVGHQPTLGRVAALLLTGEEADWSVKKGGVWWFTSRHHNGEPEVVLQAVMSPDLA